ncbi:MAG: hypothetical protein HY962_00505 [Ignavibacteriae bacterium]|nr:hypothetical protein [Ignavibacteriota bacterium]
MTGGSRRFLCGLLIAWLCVISLESCGGSSAEVTTSGLGAGYRYAPSAELGTALVQTATGDVVARCPKGWMETMDVKNAPQIALWLVKEDYSASISFTPIAMDPALYATLKKDGLRSVAKVSLNLKKDYAQDSVKVIQETEYFRLNNRDFAAYEYSAGASDVVRVVVFDTGSRFMECVVMPATAPRDAEEIHRDFIVQQSVLASMVLR